MTEPAARPLLVVEGTDAAMAFAVAEVTAGGWTVVAGFDGPPGPVRCARSGTVHDRASAGSALLAVIAGDGLIAHATADRDVIDRLVDDLRRLGPVDHRSGEPEAQPVISSEARAILGLLAEGHSLGEAAAILGLARRTADRRLAEARRALGTERTTEAIARARRLGWLRADERTPSP